MGHEVAPNPDGAVGLWQGSLWPKQRTLVFWALWLMITISAFVSGAGSAKGYVSWAIGTAILAALWRWRASRMGLRVTPDGIEVVRAFDTFKLSWSEVERFFARDAGPGVWGDKTIHVQRRRFVGQRVPDGVGVRIPTLGFVSQRNVIGRRFGPNDLCNGPQRIPQGEKLVFLNNAVAAHTSRGLADVAPYPISVSPNGVR
jgi:hypothetical protein